MIKRFLYFIPLILVIFALAACDDSSSKKDIPAIYSGPGLYIFGDDYVNSVSHAGFWNDGGRHNFSQADSHSSNAIYTDSSFYISGYDDTDYDDRVCYWKGYAVTYLEDAPADDASISDASAIRVHNGAIYAAGNTGYSPVYACYWNNGNRVNLETATASFGQDIFITDTHVYVFGTYSSSGYHACVWKDGTRSDLNAGGGTGNYLRGYTQNGDILYIPYLGGYITFDLTDDTSAYVTVTGAHMLNKVKVISGHVYSVGTKNVSGDKACLWIDGTEQFEETVNSEALDVAVDGIFTYMCGINNTSNAACYWENGVRYSLSSASGSRAHTIMVMD